MHHVSPCHFSQFGILSIVVELIIIHIELVMNSQGENIYKQGSSSSKSQNNYRNIRGEATEESTRETISPHFLLQWAAKPQLGFKISESKGNNEQRSKTNAETADRCSLGSWGTNVWGQENKFDDSDD